MAERMCSHVYVAISVLVFLEAVTLAAKCGRETYNNKTSFCCGSTVYEKHSGGFHWRCCKTAGKPYSNRQICCGDKVKEMHEGYKCCREQRIYNQTSEKCCLESGLVLPLNGSHSCCGMSTFEPRRELCCGYEGRRHRRRPNKECCGSRKYDNRTHDCLDDMYIVNKGNGSCGDKEFNPAQEFCCEDEVKDLSELKTKSICCHDMIYPRSETHHCYDGRVFENGHFPCGEEIFNPKSHLCCGGVVKERSGNFDCCDTDLINMTTHGCCKKTASFLLSKKQCCGDVIVGKSRQCCGDSVLKKNQVCCDRGKYAINKTKISHNSCCYGNQTFNNKTHRCVGTLIVPLNQGMCGMKRMNSGKDLCCERTLIRNGLKRKLECCGMKAIPKSCDCCHYPYGRKAKCNCSKLLKCRKGIWSELTDDLGCLKQASIVTRKKKGKVQIKKTLLGGKQKKKQWKLHKSCRGIKKRFILIETTNGDIHLVKAKPKNKKILRNISQTTCV